MTFRQATAADAASISSFARRVFDETFCAANDPADMAAYMDSAFTAALQAGELADPARRYLIGEYEGAVALYARIDA